ncbi:MAG TPA: RecQ family ATP-dependent DNA helicase [Ilumatobacteraceae bacterium]
MSAAAERSSVDTKELDRLARREMDIRLTSVQRRAIESVIAGRDTLLVSPTGSGKSAVYQVAGALLEGITVVVSPLIALQEDQCLRLNEMNIGTAVTVNSMGGNRRRADALRQIASGAAQFALLGPEQLRTSDVRDVLSSAAIDRLIVDEAHCIDSWGPDLRPDFLALGATRPLLRNPPVLALTATAAPHVRTEIARALRMVDVEEVVTEVERENIDIIIRRHADRQVAIDEMQRQIDATDGRGLVYVGSRRETTELADLLDRPHRRAVAYHGSLRSAEREKVHALFRSEQPVVVVATNAFGLGIDAPDVRFVHHLDAPETIDSYYQELGRAGRDGDAATAVLHVTQGRAGSRRFAAGASVPDLHLCGAIVDRAGTADADLESLRRDLGCPRGRVLQAVRLLEDAGVVHLTADLAVARGDEDFDEHRDHICQAIEQRAALLASRREMMRSFVESDACRWSLVTGYLGSPELETCGHCDTCGDLDRGRSRGEGEVRVRHVEFGEGSVVDNDGDRIVVLFDKVGYKTLSQKLVAEEDLLDEISDTR